MRDCSKNRLFGCSRLPSLPVKADSERFSSVIDGDAHPSKNQGDQVKEGFTLLHKVMVGGGGWMGHCDHERLRATSLLFSVRPDCAQEERGDGRIDWLLCDKHG